MRKYCVLLLFFLVGCQHEATPYNSKDDCWDETQSIGFYFELTRGCDEGSQILEGENGGCWLFDDGCSPDEFQPSVKCDALGERRVKRCDSK